MSEPHMLILHFKSFMYRVQILMKSLDKWNTTSKVVIMVSCCNYNQKVVLCVQAQDSTSAPPGKCHPYY